MKCLGLHNKPTAEVHLGHVLTGPKEEEKEEEYKVLQTFSYCPGTEPSGEVKYVTEYSLTAVPVTLP
jgi:hypothetical protein